MRGEGPGPASGTLRVSKGPDLASPRSWACSPSWRCRAPGWSACPPRSPGTRSSRAARPRFRASLGAGPAGDHQPRSSSPVRHRTCSNNPSRAPLRRTWATTSRPSARALSSSSLTVISVSPSSGSGLHKPLNGLRRARAGSAGRNLWLDLSAARLRVGTAPVDWSRADGRRGAGACPTGRPRTSGSPVGQAGGALPNRRQAPAPREHPATIRDRIVNRPWRTPRPSPGTGHLPKDTHQRPARQDGRGGRRHRQHDLAGDRIEQMPSSSPRSSRRTHTPHHPPRDRTTTHRPRRPLRSRPARTHGLCSRAKVVRLST